MPIIDNNTFLQAVSETIAALPPAIRGIAATANGPQSITNHMRYVEAQIDQMDTDMQALLGDARYTIGHRAAGFQRLQAAGKPGAYNLIAPAFETQIKRNKLLGVMGGHMLPFLCLYKGAKHPAVANIGVAQIADFTGPDANCLAVHGVTTARQAFWHNLTTCIRHIVDDWDDLEALFFRTRNGAGDIGWPDMTLMSLKKVTVGDSDPHKGGKRVCLLDFALRLDAEINAAPVITTTTYLINTHRRTADVIRKLVYKPSDLEIDYRIAGSSQAIEGNNDLQYLVQAGAGNVKRLPAISANGGSLLEMLNAIAGIPVEFPVYRILPRSPGSRLHANGNGDFPFHDSYGYIEFLTHDPKPSNFNGEPNKADYKAAQKGDGLDWIASNNQEIVDYYTLMGWIGVIAEVFGMADLHKENMIVHRLKPHLIDLEITMKVRIEAFQTTLITMIFGAGIPPEQKCHLFKQGTVGKHRTTRWTVGTRSAAIMSNSIQAAANFLSTPAAQAAIDGWLGDATLGDVFVRYTAAETGYYWMSFIACYMAAPLGPAPAAPVDYTAGWFATNFNTGLKEWYDQRDGMGFINHQPNFALRSEQHDFACYMNCDLPAFYRRLNSLELINARGEVCQIQQPNILPATVHSNRANPRPIAGARYFDYYPGVHLFNNQNIVHAHLNMTYRNLFNTGGINLNPAPAAALVKQSENHWMVIDGNDIYHIIRENDGEGGLHLRFYQACSAIEITQRQYERFRTNDDDFRDHLAAEAQDAITGCSVAQVGRRSYNGF